jgi:signal transduction histidine kinase
MSDPLAHTEAVLVWLRWLGVAAIALTLGTVAVPVGRGTALAVAAAIACYAAIAHLRMRQGRDPRMTAVLTTAGDAASATGASLVSGGIASPLYPFLYLTVLGGSLRFGMAHTLAICALNAGLSIALFVLAPGSHAGPGDLAIRLFFLLFVALMGGVLARDLRAARDRSRTLLWRLFRAQEEERARVAGEIHDRVGGQLFELFHRLDAEAARVAPVDASAAERLARVATAARASADEVRQLQNTLRPSLLDDFGFVEALRDFAAALQQRSGLSVRLHIDDRGTRTAPETDAMLFRVLQEAILNVRKHAGASGVEIDFTRDASGAATLAIADDGRGFDPTAVPAGHLGLLYMRERAEACGGALTVSSQPEKGTRLEVRLP